MLEVCLRKFHIADLQPFLDKSRLAKIRLAAFQGDHAFHAGMLRQDEALGAFQRAQFQNRFRMRGITKKSLHSFVPDCTDAAAISALVDPELVDPRTELRELFFQGCHGGSSAPPLDANLARLCRQYLTSRDGARDPP